LFGGVPESQYQESNGRMRPDDLRSQTAALRSAIADTLAALDRLTAQLADLLGRVEEPVAEPLPAPPEDEPAAIRRPGPVRGRLARGPGACAVCGRQSGARSRRDLVTAGWAIAGRQAICPECAATGWRFGEKGGVPFRRAPPPWPHGR
jgi:hypothetical protein